MLNNRYTVIVGSPLLRPGLTISTECSGKYLVDVVATLMGAVRQINDPPQQVVSYREGTNQGSGRP